MNEVALVVLSHYPDLFRGFEESVRKYEPGMFKLLVRDGELIKEDRAKRLSNKNWGYVNAEQPFNYARNVNLGWKSTDNMDVILCGDDVRFESRFVEELQKAAYSNEKVGVSTIQLWGQSPFVCGYFKRSVIEAVGSMDERFTGYGKEDVDWCRRMEALGYYTLPTEAVKAKHGGGTSFLRRAQETGKSMEQMCDESNRQFEEKWQEKSA